MLNIKIRKIKNKDAPFIINNFKTYFKNSSIAIYKRLLTHLKLVCDFVYCEIIKPVKILYDHLINSVKII